MDTTPPPARPENPVKPFLREIIEFALLTLLIVLPIRFYIAEPFIVSGASMVPTFESGDYLVIDQLTYRFREPERGEVIVFKYPNNPSKYFIKRIIGLPGETVSIDGGVITIKNVEHPDGIVLEETYETLPLEAHSTYELEVGEYFVLGDNRPVSSDSRVWGALPREDIVGRPVIRLFPLSSIDTFPGLPTGEDA